MKNQPSLSLKQLMLLLCLLAVTGAFAQTGARYLIITNDNFYDAIQPLAQWKQKKGMMCTVVKTSQIGTTSDQIRGYIVNAYNTWNPRPEFVLLVGGGSYVPAFNRGSHMSRIYSDNPFANISGDYRAELPYGRFPCKTARQCSIMVAKTLAYERTPYLTDTLWFRAGTGVVNDSNDSDGYVYWQDMRTLAGWLSAAGCTRFDTIASLRHQNAGNVVQSVNSGTSFVLYRGAATSNWYTPFAVNPSNTSNGNRLPIICSFTCQTVALDQIDTMIGDAWLKVGTPQQLQGAVAFIGNTHSASHVANIRSAMTNGYFSGVFPESLTTVGAATLRGKQQIFTQFNDSIEYMGFNLLGDPELNIWTTTPHAMTVSHDSLIPVGPDSLTVTVSQFGAPLPGALVCIQGEDGAIYQYGYTDGSGRRQFGFTTTQPGALDVTVTRHNCIPYEGQIWVGATSVTDYLPAGHGAPIRLSVSPNPALSLAKVACEPGAKIRVFAASGKLVQEMTARADGSSSVILNTRGMPAGVYVVRETALKGVAAALLQVVK